MDKLRVAVIGNGNISGVHIPSYKNNARVKLVALCDCNEKVLQAAGEKYGVTALYTDYNELLKRDDVDAVSVCVWNNMHAPITIAALKAGKHVLCEKPMALNDTEAREMEAAAKQSGKKLMIGFVRRFGKDTDIVRDFIHAGNVGEIYYAKATYIRRNGNPGGWFGDKKRSGGGPLIDLGVHIIDQVRYFMGNPKAVSVYGATFRKLGNRINIKGNREYRSVSAGQNDVCDVEDLASAMIRFDNGAVLAIETSFSLNVGKNEGKLELYGTKGGVKLDPEFSLYTEVNDYLADVTLPMSTTSEFGEMFQNEIDHFVSAILDGTPVKAPAEDGVELMKILTAIYKSAETGHEVVID